MRQMILAFALAGCSSPAPEAPPEPPPPAPVEEPTPHVQAGPQLIRSADQKEWGLTDNWLAGERVAFNAMVKRDREDIPLILELKDDAEVNYATLTIDGLNGEALTGRIVPINGKRALVTSIDLARADQIAQARKVTLTLVSPRSSAAHNFTQENIAAWVKLLDEYRRVHP